MDFSRSFKKNSECKTNQDIFLGAEWLDGCIVKLRSVNYLQWRGLQGVFRSTILASRSRQLTEENRGWRCPPCSTKVRSASVFLTAAWCRLTCINWLKRPSGFEWLTLGWVQQPLNQNHSLVLGQTVREADTTGRLLQGRVGKGSQGNYSI